MYPDLISLSFIMQRPLKATKGNVRLRRPRAKGPNGRSLSRFPQHDACLEVLLLPSGRDVSPSQGYPPAVCRRYPFIYHLGEERQSG